MHLVFDLDGVLLDSESDRAWLDRALDAALDELGLPATSANRSRLYPVDVAGFHALADDVGVNVERLWEVRHDHYLREKLGAIESGELAPFDDVVVLGELVGTHVLHIISNSPQTVVEAFVTTYGYEPWFDVRLGRDATLEGLQRLKPDPYQYHELVDRLETPASFVYVGDTETDRAFAEATGMRFVHLTRDGRGVESLRALPNLLG